MFESKCYSMEVVIVPILVLYTVWLTLVSFFMYRFYRQYATLNNGVEKENVLGLVQKLMKQQGLLEQLSTNQAKQIKQIEEENKLHIQKIGFVRYNPFNETGGDNSFSLSLLDKQANGFVLTCLHTRDRTRVYAKPIKSGKSTYELSKEESKALDNALKGK